MYGVVSEGSRPRDNSDVAWLMNKPWHNTNLGLPRGDDSGTIGPDKTSGEILKDMIDLYHVQGW